MKSAISLFSLALLLMQAHETMRVHSINGAVVISNANSAQQTEQKQYDSQQAAEEKAYLRTEFTLNRICVIGKKNLWILGEEGDEKYIPHDILLRSSDAGLSWQKQRIEAEGRYNAIHFIDAQTGWIAGVAGNRKGKDEGVILKTTDGGKSWLRYRTPCASLLLEIQFLNRNTGLMIGFRGELLLTEDGGTRWKLYDLEELEFKNATRLNSFSFKDKFNIWGVGDEGQVYQSTDFGISWKARDSELSAVIVKDPKHYVDYLRVEFITSKVGFITADVINEQPEGYYHSYVLLRTENGGRSWSPVLESEDFDFRDLSFINDKDGWIMSIRGGHLLRTRDGGKTWRELERLPPEIGHERLHKPTERLCEGISIHR